MQGDRLNVHIRTWQQSSKDPMQTHRVSIVWDSGKVVGHGPNMKAAMTVAMEAFSVAMIGHFTSGVSELVREVAATRAELFGKG
jgi:hypothetical protein